MPLPLRLAAARYDGRTAGIESGWGERAHPLARNEWKVDAAGGVLVQALAPLLGLELD